MTNNRINPKVSVLIVTYNHEKFIAKAIESALMQKTKFNYNIVIGEDYSTDKTREIVKKFKNKYPKKIKLLLNKKNLGMIKNRKKTFLNCDGEYIALLDGDDYWTDKHKLQKQVNFLDKNPDFAICFHDMKIINEKKPEYSKRFVIKDIKEISTIENLFNTNFIPTSSAMLRNKLRKLPKWYNNMPTGDAPLLILNAQYGKIRYFDKVMGIYRIHDKGYWNSKNELEKKMSLLKKMEILEKNFKNNEHYLHIIQQKKRNIYKNFSSICYYEANQHFKKGKIFNGLNNLFLAWKYNEDKFRFYKYPSYFKKIFLNKKIYLFFINKFSNSRVQNT
jgi:glycosyltransferase involved in cell wall biosynthesis